MAEGGATTVNAKGEGGGKQKSKEQKDHGASNAGKQGVRWTRMWNSSEKSRQRRRQNSRKERGLHGAEN